MTPNLSTYGRIIVMFSGGKDSLACVLELLELGVPKAQIELWHHDVDGREGSTLMDWPVTRDYCRKVAAALGLPLYFSWKEGGFEQEMLRDESATGKTWFETPFGLQHAGGNGPDGTRQKFPQVSADLKVRWCSAYLKIDVAAAAIRNQIRFKGGHILVVTGERAEESTARSKYKTFEPHRTHGASRHVDHWRPIHAWGEEEVWNLIQIYRVNPHPAYKLGWGRLSCMKCIFGSPNQWASVRLVDPEGFEKVAAYEESFGVTIQRKLSIRQLADRGTPYPSITPELIRQAMSLTYDDPVFVKKWELPVGAFGESIGPT